MLTSIYNLADLLGAPFSIARDIVISEPRLFTHKTQCIASELLALHPYLPAGGDGRIGAALLRTAPALLLPGGRGASLRAKFAALAGALGVDPLTVVQAAAVNAQVLEAPVDGAAAALDALVSAGVAPPQRVADILLAQPTLMHYSVEVSLSGGSVGWLVDGLVGWLVAGGI